MNKILLVLAGMAVVFGLVQASAASSVDDQVAARIKKVGAVCVEGSECAQATAGSAMAAAGGADPKALYDKSCATCHAIGVAGAPKLGNAGDWAPRIAKGKDVLYISALNGLAPGMPAKGLCFTCSDDDLKLVVDFMVSAAK